MYNGRRVEIFCVQDEGISVGYHHILEIEKTMELVPNSTVGKIILFKS
jgi:hypothetical protein